jgi:hypothetical protein
MFSRFEHWKGRASRFALALLVHVLAVIIGYYLSPPIRLRKPEPVLQVTMLPSLEEKQEKPKPKPRTARRSKTTPRPAAIQLPEPIVPLPMMIVSSDVFRASDISRMRSSPQDEPGPELADDGDRSVGEGPGGAKVYQAEWYREPTDAEINGYLPRNLRQSGWGLIICRTIADYHVEDCRELGEWPHGSGLARSMRQAAWQFRVRPTRIGGKPQIGTWVRIRFDLTQGFKK